MKYQNTDRTVLRISGSDHLVFLNGLISNGLGKGAAYAAILSPQGKYLFDFLLLPIDGAVLLDIKSDCAADLSARLSMYKLRADVVIEDSKLNVIQGFDNMPEDAFLDPRTPDLGWRQYSDCEYDSLPVAMWDALRVKLVVPEIGVELIANESYILEAGFERLNGVDFRKGCYVGQEITARMKHKTELKKGLVKVSVDGNAVVGTPILADGKAAGTLFTVVDGVGLAHLRYDRATGDMNADNAVVRRI